MASSCLGCPQKANLAPINEAINGLLIEEEDAEALRESIETYDNFDQIQLATRLEKHELTQMRRIAIFIFKKNLRWKQALALCKRDKLWKDAIEAAAQVRQVKGCSEQGVHACRLSRRRTARRRFHARRAQAVRCKSHWTRKPLSPMAYLEAGSCCLSVSAATMSPYRR